MALIICIIIQVKVRVYGMNSSLEKFLISTFRRWSHLYLGKAFQITWPVKRHGTCQNLILHYLFVFLKTFGKVCLILVCGVTSNRYADQLYEDLLYFYNKNVRPVRNASSAVQVKFGASLIRIIDVVKNFTELLSWEKKQSKVAA